MAVSQNLPPLGFPRFAAEVDALNRCATSGGGGPIKGTPMPGGDILGPPQRAGLALVRLLKSIAGPGFLQNTGEKTGGCSFLFPLSKGSGHVKSLGLNHNVSYI